MWAQWTEAGSGIVVRRPVLGSLIQGHTHSSNSACYAATIVDDSTSARDALKLLRRNDAQSALVYRGHYGNALQLLSALKRRSRQSRSDNSRKRSLKRHKNSSGSSLVVKTKTVQQEWRLHRHRAQREASETNRLLIETDPSGDNDHECATLFPNLSKAPPKATLQKILMGLNKQQHQAYLIPLREVLARNGGDQWRTHGVFVPQLENFIYPHFGVYPPTRQEYLDLLPLKVFSHQQRKRQFATRMMDVGTGSGVLAAILLQNHPSLIAVCTDINPLAIQCARENLHRLGFTDRVQFYETTDGDLFANNNEPVDLLVCNPPWIPTSSSSGGGSNGSGINDASWIDRAIYDPDCRMLYGFLRGAALHLRDHDSEAWLILSDLAEHLQLRSWEELRQHMHDGGLEIAERRIAKKVKSSTRTSKSIAKAKREEEAMFPKVAAAREAETTYLYRLRKQLL